MIRKPQNFIGGKQVPSSGRAAIEVLSAASHQPLARVPDSAQADVDAAVDMAAGLGLGLGCGCIRAARDDGGDGFDRRRVIRIAAATGAAVVLGPLAPSAAHARPKAGDLLVADDVESNPVALKAADLVLGKPVLAFPFDPATQQIRNDSRLNKVVLVKVAEGDLDVDTRERAAGGVLAFSAICTHQACDVKTWVAADKALVCFCHSSKFKPLEAGRVSDGPAPRALPILPLKLQDGRLAVAGAFLTPPGVAT